jgi:hypothetical protein
MSWAKRTELYWDSRINFGFRARLSFQFALSAMEASKMHFWAKSDVRNGSISVDWRQVIASSRGKELLQVTA